MPVRARQFQGIQIQQVHVKKTDYRAFAHPHDFSNEYLLFKTTVIRQFEFISGIESRNYIHTR